MELAPALAADHETVTEPSVFGVDTAFPGVPGAPAQMSFEADDGGLVPSALVAVTVNV